MVIRFPLPKWSTGSIQDEIRRACRLPFSALQNRAQCEIGKPVNYQVDMVRHDHPIMENILLIVKMLERLRDDGGNLGLTQMATSQTLIKMFLNLSLQFEPRV